MFENFKKRQKFKKLNKKSKYAISKMKEHVNDADATEFKKWLCLNCLYNLQMLEYVSQNKRD